MTGGDGHFVLDRIRYRGSFASCWRAWRRLPGRTSAARPVGTTHSVRGPLGDGFPIERAVERDVLLVSAGAGIAAIRPLLLGFARDRSRKVWLYHGSRTLEHVPFAADLKAAQSAGATVTVAVSSSATGESVTGRVQHAIERERPDLANAVAFVSGMDAMVRGGPARRCRGFDRARRTASSLNY